MATKKSTAAPKLPDNLQAVVGKLVDQAGEGKSISEDDVQVAIADIDVDDDELGDIYDAVRAQGEIGRAHV